MPRDIRNHLLWAALFGLSLVMLAAGPSFAAEGGEGGEHGDKKDAITDVALPPILAPLVVNGRLTAYAYMTIALTPAAGDKQADIRLKVPFLQDAFLRELNKGSIVKADDTAQVDTEAVRARLMPRMEAILPKGTASDLKIQQVVITPLTQKS